MSSLMLCTGQEIGSASHYSVHTNGGTRTASGIKLNDKQYTAAHKKLKFGTLVKVTNLANNKTAVVKITDRGPYVKGRIIDVSQIAAKALDFQRKGIARVKIEVVKLEVVKHGNNPQQERPKANLLLRFFDTVNDLKRYLQ